MRTISIDFTESFLTITEQDYEYLCQNIVDEFDKFHYFNKVEWTKTKRCGKQSDSICMTTKENLKILNLLIVYQNCGLLN